ncbi:MAG: hypothetical protein IJT04_07730 [Bacteroidales bacterium]|nr:hypothetical protein [Bacteroidales bacterium]
MSPADIISGHFINKGYIRVTEIKPEIARQTIVINYGETDRGYINLSRRVSIVIQLVSANNNELIGVCKGEGQGETDADAVKNAIDRCLEAFFYR